LYISTSFDSPCDSPAMFRRLLARGAALDALTTLLAGLFRREGRKSLFFSVVSSCFASFPAVVQQKMLSTLSCSSYCARPKQNSHRCKADSAISPPRSWLAVLLIRSLRFTHFKQAPECPHHPYSRSYALSPYLQRSSGIELTLPVVQLRLPNQLGLWGSELRLGQARQGQHSFLVPLTVLNAS
jgi:hypothetical protein